VNYGDLAVFKWKSLSYTCPESRMTRTCWKRSSDGNTDASSRFST
jgi:hypothetical protein